MVSTQNIHKSRAKQTKAKYFKNVIIIKISEQVWICCGGALDAKGNPVSTYVTALIREEDDNFIMQWLAQFD